MDETNDFQNGLISLTQDESSQIFDVMSISSWDLTECRKRLIALSRDWEILQEDNKNKQSHISELEISLEEKQCEIKVIEQDRETLRNTVKKASQNWLQRKAKLSESEGDFDRDSLSSTVEGSTEESQAIQKYSIGSDERFRLMFDLKFKTEQLELSERQCEDLKNRVREYEALLNDQEAIVHGLKEQLDTYFTDNKKMSKQLAQLVHLFKELEAANNQEVAVPSEIPISCETPDALPTSEDFNEMSKSVSKTYVKLKELIYEKKSLVTEIERLNTLNVELQTRVSQQENRLVNVSDALQATWLVVSNLKEDHAKLHTDESIIRYELKEKREILTKLREELEWAREQWHTIRQINSQSEEEWKSLRTELDERNERNRTQSDCSELADGSELGACGPLKREISFEPPVDLLLDMGIEHGIIDADAEEPATGVALMGGDSVNEDRLLNLETECSHLYHKLMSSTSRALALASRLTTLHQHYSASDEDEDDQDEEEYEYVDMEDNIFETEAESPDPAGYDTAYVSETDGTDSAAEGPAVPQGESSDDIEGALGEALADEASFINSDGSVDDGCDVLSRRLITFLPKKIEILKIENKKLEEKIQMLQEEKNKSELLLGRSIEYELRQKKKLEEQLSHLGKCVDELKLERNGKIAQQEEELKKKLNEVKSQQEKHQELVDELEDVKEKLKEKEELFHAAVQQSENSELRAITAENALASFQGDLNLLRMELRELRNMNHRSRPRYSSSRSKIADKRTSLQLKEFTEESIMSIEKEIKSEAAYIVSSCSDCVQVQYFPMVPCRIGLLAKHNVFLSPSGILFLQLTLNAEFAIKWSLRVSSKELKFVVLFKKPSKVMGASGEENTCDQLTAPMYLPSSNDPHDGVIFPNLNGEYTLLLVNQFDQCIDLSYEFLVVPRSVIAGRTS